MTTLISTERPGDLTPPAPRIGHPLFSMIARRLGAGALTLLAGSLLIFLACNLLPGDVAQTVLGKNATPARVLALRHSLHLDQPVLERYAHWLGGVLTGNLGNSTTALIAGGNASIWKEAAPALTNSLALAGITLLLLIPLSVLLGTIAGARAGKLTDHATSAAALLLGSLPEFVLGAVLILVFFQWLGWFPPVSILAPGQSPLAHPNILVLPIATLLGVTIAGAARQIRAGVIDVSREDYVGLARLNGLPNRKVWLQYTIRNALAPSVQILAQSAQYLIGGIIIVEGVFNYPGIGLYLVNAVSDRDVPVIEGVSVILAGAYILINIVADVIVVLLVPALRTNS
jgi:peptide/nickel transport system permease protein